ncbi:response regulator FixJ [Rhodoligotrophos ferricapiens]|uniref:response regulator FixJ n=1 Tax=Rhodoligotrophos ferricapiens TaxID=3069264 RepID=UPI00315C7052
MTDKLIYVIDDDEAVRESLSFLLASAGLAVRTHESATEFLSAFDSRRCGCVVTDVRMPEMSGLDLLKEVKARDSRLPVIVMTGHGDIPMAVDAMKHGALDFIEKPFDDEVIISAVTAALGARDQEAQREAQLAEISRRHGSLSPRERDVLEQLVAGKPNKVIAFELGISPRTVEVYRASLMTKMQAASLSELVRMRFLMGPV